MNRAGLVSITFRNKAPREIVALMKRAGLSQVEWGGDVHVKPGAGRAVEVRRMTENEGLRTSAYGSYYHLEENAFEPWLDEAEALGAPVIRVWAGRKGSAEVDERERETLVRSLNDCVRQAAERSIVVSLEYHPNTLTDSRDSVRRLMRESAVSFHWQPRWDWPEEERLAALKEVVPRLTCVHTFTWRHTETGIVRLPLSDGAEMWNRVPALSANAPMLLEFVENDSDEALLRDAAWLCARLEK